MSDNGFEVRLDDIECVRWRCPHCSATVDIPVQEEVSPFNSPDAVASCPVCKADFDGADEGDLGVFWLESVRLSIKRSLGSNPSILLVARSAL